MAGGDPARHARGALAPHGPQARQAGSVKLRAGASVDELVDDDRWLLDDPPSAAWFDHAAAESWTRDPFDRLLVAHARMRKWALATADGVVLENLGGRGVLEL